MTAKSKLRGYDIEYRNNEWVYAASGIPTVGNRDKTPCGNCGEMPTTEGHDMCLGNLPGVMNACCGHGDVEEAYIQFLDGNTISGESAVIILEELKKENEENQCQKKET